MSIGIRIIGQLNDNYIKLTKLQESSSGINTMPKTNSSLLQGTLHVDFRDKVLR